MILKKDVESIANILRERKGVDKALEYCSTKVKNYEERIVKAPSNFDGMNEKESHQIMIEFYLAVSLMLQDN